MADQSRFRPRGRATLDLTLPLAGGGGKLTAWARLIQISVEKQVGPCVRKESTRER
jgi:hypothetical protein